MTAAPAPSLSIASEQLELASLRLSSGPFVLEAARVSLQKVAGQLRAEGGTPRLAALEAASAELSGVTLQGPLRLPPQAEAALHGAWSLAPLAAAEGVLRAEIVDAHLLFDADVTVPIRQGQVDFNTATVEHVGPDSRMGVSRLGLYVDAANGRSYLYQFTSAPVAGVEFERRSPLPGPWGSERGRLRLQEFLEGLLRQPLAAPGHGITDQARLLFDRTAVSGHVQLGDGKFAGPGVQAELARRSGESNLLRLHSESVGRGLRADIASLSMRQVVLRSGERQVRCDELLGSVAMRVSVDGGQLRLTLELPALQVSGVRIQLDAGAGG